MDGPDYLRFVLALAFVLALMGILAHLIKRMGWGKIGMPGKKEKRLAVLELRALDSRHRLALVKCDAREYLLLLSPESQCVVDSNFQKAAPE
jgi:flagellar protein FliO/FliZ